MRKPNGMTRAWPAGPVRLAALVIVTAMMTAVAAMGQSSKNAWEIGGGVTSPAVAGGRIYVGAGTSLYAFDAVTGAVVWTAPVDTLFSSPAVSGGRVFVGAGPRVYAVDAATGAIVWIANAGSPSAGVWSSPAVVGGRVFVGVNDFGAPDIYAIDAETGQVEWTAYNPYAVTLSSPAVAGGLVYIASTDSVLAAHDAETGALVWSRGISTYTSSPTVANGVVYAGGGFGLYVLDAATGTTLKSFGFGGAH